MRLSRLKGERRRQFLDPVFECLPTCAGEFRPIWTPLGVVPLCPVGASCVSGRSGLGRPGWRSATRARP